MRLCVCVARLVRVCVCVGVCVVLGCLLGCAAVFRTQLPAIDLSLVETARWSASGLFAVCGAYWSALSDQDSWIEKESGKALGPGLEAQARSMCAMGKHQALNPTSQRLLAASKLALSKEDKTKPKAKGAPKAKAKAKAKMKAAATAKKKKKGKAAASAHPDSIAYMAAKKDFLEKYLGRM